MANGIITTAPITSNIYQASDAYSPTKSYAVGDLCIYNNVLYRCTTACSAGSWATNKSCFTQDTLVNVANTLDDKLHYAEFNTTITCNAQMANTGIYRGDGSVDFPTDASIILGVIFRSNMDAIYYGSSCWSGIYTITSSTRKIGLTAFCATQNRGVVVNGYILYT